MKMQKPGRIHQKGVLAVSTVNDLLAAPFGRGHNVILLPGSGERALSGGFNDLATALGANEKEYLLGMPDIRSRLSPLAAAFPDQTARTGAALVRSDTHLFHADFGGNLLGRFITCYTGPATEGLAMGDSMPAAALPGVRRRMRAEFARATGENLPPDSPRLDQWMARHRDLRTTRVPVKGARPFSFAPGDFWLQAVEGRDRDVTEPFAHRAPRTRHGMPPRLLLSGDRFA